MSADDAFDNLMNRNALNIPVAKASGGTGRGGPKAAPVPSGDGYAAGAGDAPGDTMRVSSLMEDTPADYSPALEDVELDATRVYNNPTDTDLEPVDDAGRAADVSNARMMGARVAGRDADADDDAAPFMDGDDDGFREAQVYDGGYDDAALDSGLGMAKRLRRFAYLPLSGADAFENRARDMAARLTSLHPERPSLLVTSAVRGEGRTELAVRLALALAKRVDHRVLLVDFDIRHPQAGARLGVSSKYFTLSDVLRGSCPLGEALVASEEDNLWVLPSRASDRDGDEVPDSRQVQGLMAQLHAIFDFTVIDCGPVSHADATILCRLAGSTVLAGFCGVSTAGAMNEAARRLEAGGARLAGVLLTGA